ncbi:ATP-binding protein [Pseudonocardia humida]|uniref:ATP-binding protein n=1 Tax=Pseudonocardia humida TaxID=2800819 RepID=A0ABT0ZTQ7_9PSEU|nr:ATP-binding protein [Pseudonocardia humida]MCO1654115.1 ATP-binding protein [Pseudonocardia humida]
MAAEGSASPGDGMLGTAVPVDGPVPPVELLVALTAEAASARVVRRRLREWLLRWGWRDDDLDDVILAVDEAVANVVDHAYLGQAVPGTVNVYAWTTTGSQGRLVTVSVTDQGRWRPVPADPGLRGRGLLMMSTCTASLHIEHSAGGTAVTMTSKPLPGSGH